MKIPVTVLTGELKKDGHRPINVNSAYTDHPPEPVNHQTQNSPSRPNQTNFTTNNKTSTEDTVDWKERYIRLAAEFDNMKKSIKKRVDNEVHFYKKK